MGKGYSEQKNVAHGFEKIALNNSTKKNIFTNE